MVVPKTLIAFVVALGGSYVAIADVALAEITTAEKQEDAGLKAGTMIAYEETIPGTDMRFKMVPVPGGVVTMGSPASEAGRKEDEGPLVQVKVQPMWVGQCEVTWAEYHAYMNLYESFKELNSVRTVFSSDKPSSTQLEKLTALSSYFKAAADVDAVTCPTPLYDSSFTYEIGDDPRQPAVTMTQYAAKQYTKWLSGITGRGYRLPSEAEWEYAARAGSSASYSFGEDSKQLADYAWFEENSEEKTHFVGTKKPNAWGLHDIHGNVAEWVLDAYHANHFQTISADVSDWESAVNWPSELYPRVVRGGCWFDEPQQCRSAARHQSVDEDWNMSDPNLPKSPWWFTEYESTGVGFRVIRPLAPMDSRLKKKVWEADIDTLQYDIEDRLEEGRGTKTSTNSQLPAAIQELEASAEEVKSATRSD